MSNWHFTPDPRLPFLNFVLPFLTVFLLMLLEFTPGTPLSGIMPWFAMPAVFYWGLYRPQHFPLWLAFLMGLVLDIISGPVLGLYAIMYVLIREVGKAQRRYLVMRNFIMLWLTFSGLLAGLLLIHTFFMTTVGFNYDSIVPLKFVQTVAVFPLLYYVLARGHHYLVYEGWI
ncbi:MAG: rod shape-determining protein MreD [Magnetococcales bacterium]|nr:rod shape-determining protein MreD [Magnetococcales bacterium]|tara:strand:+ start:115918 stop:116433 length:516 start_codon:yes stop_codon:yes gene_type:complete